MRGGEDADVDGLERATADALVDREIRTEISNFRRCRADCPEAGGAIKITNVVNHRAIELRYDGSNQATFVGPRGETASVRLLCRP